MNDNTNNCTIAEGLRRALETFRGDWDIHGRCEIVSDEVIPRW